MQYEYLEKKLALKPKTLDDNTDDDDDVERSKRRWQPTKDSRAKKRKLESFQSLTLFISLYSKFSPFFLGNLYGIAVIQIIILMHPYSLIMHT